MKKLHIFLVLIGFFALVVIAFNAFNSYIYNEKQGEGVTVVPSEVVEELSPTSNRDTQILITEVQDAIASKHGSTAATLTVSVKELSGNYAKGEASQIGEGGGIWFAAKDKGVWQLVYDGNGIIQCSELKEYPDFPSRLIPQCFDDQENKLVTR